MFKTHCNIVRVTDATAQSIWALQPTNPQAPQEHHGKEPSPRTRHKSSAKTKRCLRPEEVTIDRALMGQGSCTNEQCNGGRSHPCKANYRYVPLYPPHISISPICLYITLYTYPFIPFHPIYPLYPYIRLHARTYSVLPLYPKGSRMRKALNINPKPINLKL